MKVSKKVVQIINIVLILVLIACIYDNAIAFRKATELVIVDDVINDKSGNISNDMVQASEYQTATNEWHVFKSKKDDSWVSMYSRNTDIAWNGYTM